ncbi:hypothetical protein BU17DRAFT_52079, partial [Hysterangium stoloniferum]
LLGHLFNWGLFGCLAVQAYVYYLAFPNDRTLPKLIVGWVMILETLQTVLSTKDAFRNFGTGWGNFEDLNEIGLLWFSVPFLGSIITTTSQLFFGWRIFVLAQKPYLPIAVLLLSLVQCGAGMAAGIRAHMLGLFSEVQSHTFPITSVWLGSSALCDVTVAASMIYYLTNSRTGFRQTDLLLTKFIRITVETGLVCATFAILDLSFFVAFQNNNYHLAPSIALSKLYANSLLVVLNARVRISGGRGISAPADDDYTLSYPSTSTMRGSVNVKKTYGNSVQVLTTSSQIVDDIPLTSVRPF